MDRYTLLHYDQRRELSPHLPGVNQTSNKRPPDHRDWNLRDALNLPIQPIHTSTVVPRRHLRHILQLLPFHLSITRDGWAYVTVLVTVMTYLVAHSC